MIKIGDSAPDFRLSGEGGQATSPGDFRGRWLVLYFYPRDNTSGCTLEAVDFSSHLEDFDQLGADVMGISPDSPESHARFRAKHGLTVRLVSDPQRTSLLAYGAWGSKTAYGKTGEGVIRSTFLVDPQGTLREAWTGVKVKGHVGQVLVRLKELQRPRDQRIGSN